LNLGPEPDTDTGFTPPQQGGSTTTMPFKVQPYPYPYPSPAVVDAPYPYPGPYPYPNPGRSRAAMTKVCTTAEVPCTLPG
jgi:hypothetical protein